MTSLLSKIINEVNIHTFVTIGSPLGLPIVVSRLFHEHKMKDNTIKRLHVPDSIWSYWYNLSDPEDKIAMDHTLSDDFLENRKGVKALDMMVHNDYKWEEEKNPHKSYGYLRTIELAKIIDDFLAGRTRNILQTHPFFINKIKLMVQQFADMIAGRNK